MSDSFLKKVITLNTNQKWFICDETTQNGDKYYLAYEIDKDNNPGENTKIFREVRENGKVYFAEDIDNDTYSYLSAIFITNYSNNTDEIIKEIENEDEEDE